MEDMLDYAGAFNQRFNAWQTGRVILIEVMFVRAFAFNQNLNGWRTSSVTLMNEMFNYAQAFDQNIDARQTGMVADLAYVAASRLCLQLPILPQRVASHGGLRSARAAVVLTAPPWRKPCARLPRLCQCASDGWC